MKIKELKKYFELFNPDMYNPEGWTKKNKSSRHEICRYYYQSRFIGLLSQ